MITAARLMKLRGTLDERNEKALGRIISSGERMTRMIEQLLDFTRIRVGGGMAFDPRPLDLGATIRQTVDEIEQALPGAAVDVELDGDLEGRWDVDRLAQVLSNLIGNAVRHGSPDGDVRVIADGSDARVVRVRVCNAGAIPPDLLPKIFEPLTEGDRRRDRSGGLGLGLYIAREIVEVHGGHLTVESSDAGGTEFTVTLPRDSAADALAPNAAGHHPPAMAREQLRASEARFRLLVDAVKDYAIFMLDPTGHVMTWNVGAQRIKGYEASEIIGQHFSRFYEEHEIRAGKCEMELEGASREGRFEDEGWRVRKDGTRFWANVVITALRDASGELVGFAKVTRDLTERRRLEQEQLRRARAEEALRLRDEFLSLASHELKTPMTVLQLQLDTLGERLTASDTKVAAKLQRATRSSERLATLIESLLDVSRIATGRFVLEREEVDLAEIVADAVEESRSAAERAGCALELAAAGPIVGRWDALRLEQVVRNLLSNAIKYGPGRPIEVSLTLEAGDVVLEVRDHGPGLPEPDRGRLFRRFERAGSLRHHSGLGLGLYFVQEIVTAHGGSVTGENAADGGARLRVRLPVGANAAIADSQAPQPETN
jgi:PAS domain S-box-containing protein